MPEQLAGGGCKRATVNPDEYTVIVQNTGTFYRDTIDALAMMNGYALYLASASAAGDECSWSFELDAGTYNYSVLALENTLSGMCDWYIDGALAVNDQDWYGGGLYNKIITASVTIPTSGLHVLKMVNVGKNVLAIGYEQVISNMWFAPTSD